MKKINEKLCNSYESKCLRPKREAEAEHTDGRSGDDPAVGWAYLERYVGIRGLIIVWINPLNAELNPICHLLALLGAQHILHISR